MPRLRLFPTLLALAVASAPAGAQDPTAEPPPPSEDRPRVGLVLSGGGARGAAHVGVLQVLEELRVPVDFVVGTSMGAIVGGLYASGYAPDELERTLGEADWSALLSDTLPRDELWFRRRQDNRRFQVDVELGWKDGGPAFPPGLILGRNVESFLEELTLPVADVHDFDELRLPFRCVATDLADGTAAVLGEGSLSRAIRASMSLPGIFAPVELGGRLLVDGGTVDNVPIDVARALGAEIVIVVDISTPLGDVSELKSPFGVSGQVLGILMTENRERSLALVRDGDVAIVPDLDEVGVLSFDRTAEAVVAGRAAARDVEARLRALGIDEEAWAAWLARQRRPEYAAYVVREVSFDGRTRLSGKVLGRFAGLKRGQRFDAQALAEARRRLYGLGAFQTVDVEVHPVPGAEGEADVLVRPVEKSWGRDYLRFGLGISSDLSGGGEFDVGIQHTRRPLNSYAGEWRNEVQVGTRTRLYTELYQPMDASLRWFVAPNVAFEQDDVPLIVDRRKIAEVNVDALRLGLDVGRLLGSWGELRVSYGRLLGTARPEIALPGLLPPSTDVSTNELVTHLTVDTLDAIAFPREGLVGALEWKLAGRSVVGDDRSSVLQGLAGVPISRGPLTVFPTLEGGATVDGEQPLGAEFRLGGFRRLSGLGPGELTGNHYGLAVLQTYYELGARTTTFGVARYVGASLEYGGTWQDLDEVDADDLLLGGSVYLGFDTLVGPSFVGVGLTEGGERAAYVFVGPIF